MIASGTRTPHMPIIVADMMNLVSPAPRNDPARTMVRASGICKIATMRRNTVPSSTTASSLVKARMSM